MCLLSCFHVLRLIRLEFGVGIAYVFLVVYNMFLYLDRIARRIMFRASSQRVSADHILLVFKCELVDDLQCFKYGAPKLILYR